MSAYVPNGNEIIYLLPVNANGVPASGTVACTAQALANLAVAGSAGTVITALNTVGAGTITAAGIFGKITSRGGTQTAVFADTTDTAVAIIAALPSGAPVGDAFQYTYYNTTGFAATIGGGVGVTMTSTVVPPNGWARFLVTYTAAGAVTIALFEAGTLGGSFGGNKLRNGLMDIWQRGTSIVATTAGAYTADGWIVTPTGASITAAQTATNPRTGAVSTYSLLLTGAASITDVTVKQRIESFIAQALAGQVVTVQAQVYNNTGGSITPTLTVKHAGTTDSWGSPVVDVNAVALQACPNTAWTNVAYSFLASASSGKGLEVTFDFGNNFAAGGQTLQLTEVQITVTPQAAASALNAAPPACETTPYFISLAFCQRYLAVFGGIQGAIAEGAATSSTAFGMVFDLPVPMRISPTAVAVTTIADLELVSYAGANVAAATALTFNATYSSNQQVFATGTVASGLTSATSYLLSANTALAGNVVFTGAEL